MSCLSLSSVIEYFRVFNECLDMRCVGWEKEWLENVKYPCERMVDSMKVSEFIEHLLREVHNHGGFIESVVEFCGFIAWFECCIEWRVLSVIEMFECYTI